jgi:hypothetical protein
VQWVRTARLCMAVVMPVRMVMAPPSMSASTLRAYHPVHCAERASAVRESA